MWSRSASSASQWLVPDLSTMMLMTRFYELWTAEQREPAEALREAQQWTRDATNGELAQRFTAVSDWAQREIPAEIRRA
jgi:CHAT domain-containing protein